MKVLAVVHKAAPHHNAGAEWMLHSILRRWVELGDECVILARDYAGEPHTFDGVQIGALHTSGVDAAAQWADRIITHLDETPRAVALAAQHDKPIAHLVHNDSQLRFFHVRAAPGVLAVFNSEWLRAAVRWPGESVVCRPHVRVADYATERQAADCITLVNLSREKGARILAACAQLAPARHFLAVRGAYGTQDVRPLSRFANVEIIDSTPTIRDVYARTRVLLMPSGYESWGRVAIEAACSGIPTLASSMPGPRESLGEAGIFLDLRTPRAWLGALDALDDASTYEQASARARARAQELEAITAADVDALRESAASLQTLDRPSSNNVGGASVSVLLPFTSDDEWRTRALAHVQAHYASEHPEWEVIVGRSSEPWSKGAALADARSRASGTVLVAADADVVLPPKELAAAVGAVLDGAHWAQPYRWVQRLAPDATQALYDGTPLARPRHRSHRAVTGGGIVVVAADVWDDVGGVDPRYLGWGGEDVSFGWALRTLHGPPAEGRGALLHLWHPHAVGRSRHRPPNPESAALLEQYRRARLRPEAMRALVPRA